MGHVWRTLDYFVRAQILLWKRLIMIIFSHLPMQLLQAENQDECDKILEECDWRFEINGLPPSIPMSRRKIFVDEVAQYYVLVQCKAMLDQLLLGLQHYQVLSPG